MALRGNEYADVVSRDIPCRGGCGRTATHDVRIRDMESAGFMVWRPYCDRCARIMVRKAKEDGESQSRV